MSNIDMLEFVLIALLYVSMSLIVLTALAVMYMSIFGPSV